MRLLSDTSTTIHVHDIISVLTGEDGEWEEDEGYVIIVFAHQSPHRHISRNLINFGGGWRILCYGNNNNIINWKTITEILLNA